MLTLATVLGGIGLFLLGMSLMTDGLKALAGESLKNKLSRFTGGTFSAIMSGATMTAIIQSSSATTFMTIGFVSAGLLTFTQSVGVIIGANLGSTSTGWIVSVIGFKISMSAFALPLIGSGILIKLLSNNRYSAQGLALAGFGLIFLGISVLQDGMANFTDFIDLSKFAGDQLWVIPILLIIGIVMTIIMQSSSAAVVTTLTALHTGVLDFHQAAILVIGQNVGTTVKAYLATLGGTITAKQTATAHILFNVLTGLIALLLLPWLIKLVFWLTAMAGVFDAAIRLALFHTVFNVVGVLAVVAIMPKFLQLVKYIYPDQVELHKKYSQYLDKSVAEIGPIAIEAARRSLMKLWLDMLDTATRVVQGKITDGERSDLLDTYNKGLSDIQTFLLKLSSSVRSTSEEEYKAHVSLVHAIDHLERMMMVLREQQTPHKFSDNKIIKKIVAQIAVNCNQLSYDEDKMRLKEDCIERMGEQSKNIAEIRKKGRKDTFKASVKHGTDSANVNAAIDIVQTIHWLDRLAYHSWRSARHINRKLKSVEGGKAKAS